MLITFFRIFRQASKTVLLFLLLPAYVLASVSVEVVDQYGEAVGQAVVSVSLPPMEAPLQVEAVRVMDQVNKRFSPKVLLVNKGDKVSFPNSDDIRHHVYSFSKAKPFEIRLYKGKDVEPVKFERPGVVILGCNIHDKMVGYIYVAGNELTAITDDAGLATLEPLTDRFYVWHPRLSASQTYRQEFSVDVDENGGIQRVVVNLLAENSSIKKRGFQSRTLNRDQK